MYINFVSVVLFLCFFAFCIGAPRTMGKSGPYETRLLSARKCSNPKPPYLNESRTHVTIELYNSSKRANLVKADIKVGLSHQNLRAKLKRFKDVKGQWKFNMAMQSDQCNGPIGILFKVLSLEYSPEKCVVPVGEYHIKDIDANIMEHTLRRTNEYGRVLWRMEVYVKQGMLFCFEFETLVVPAQ